MRNKMETIQDKKAIEEVVNRLLRNVLEQKNTTIVFHPEWYKKNE